VATRVHANHPFYSLALLAPLLFAAPLCRWLFAGLSLTLFVNEAWHDVGVADALPSILPGEAIFWVPILNSALNVALLLLWAWALPGLIKQVGTSGLRHFDTPTERQPVRAHLHPTVSPSDARLG
jgi:hypothetical protein